MAARTQAAPTRIAGADVIRNRLVAAVVGTLLAVGIAVGVSTPAQAFSAFTFYASCSTPHHQMAVQNYSGWPISVRVDSPLDPVRYYTIPASVSGAVTYIPVVNRPVGNYTFSGIGSLNWYYWYGCYA